MQKTLHNNTALPWIECSQRMQNWTNTIATFPLYWYIWWKKNGPLLFVLFNLIQAICTLHWIFGVSNCICGEASCKFLCWSLFRAEKSKTELNTKRNEEWCTSLRCVRELVIGMNVHRNGQTERCEGRGHERLMVFCCNMSGYSACIQKCAFCTINDYCKPILSIFMLGVATSSRSPSSCKWSVLTVLNHFYARQQQQMQLLKDAVPTFTKMAYCKVWRETCRRHWSWIPN